MAALLNVLLVSVILLFGSITSEKTSSNDVSSSIAKFSGVFAKAVDSDSNSVSSPLSAEILLSLLSLGATGKAREEIWKTLRFNDEDTIRSGMSEVSTKLKSVKGVELKVANKVYVKEGEFKLNQTFQNNAVSVFHAELEKTNFNEPTAAADAINSWVESKTNNKIKNLIDPSSISADTALVLVNALYFKGSWQHKFPEEATRDGLFHEKVDKKVNVPFMHLKERFFYGESKELDARLLELPYAGNEASLLVVLPNKVDGLSGLLEKLATGSDLLKAADAMWKEEVIVSLPKFKIETTIDLKDILIKLGVRTMFESGHSDLSNLVEPKTALFVSKAIQKAYIEVNEVGTEAAAASAFGIALMSLVVGPEPPVFTADRPFLAVLRVGTDVVFTANVRDFS